LIPSIEKSHNKAIKLGSDNRAVFYIPRLQLAIDRGTLGDDGADPGDDHLVGGVLLVGLEVVVGGMLGDEHHVPVTLDNAEMLPSAILNVPLRSAVAFESVRPVMDAASREACNLAVALGITMVPIVEHGHRLDIAAPINGAILDIAQRIEESSLEPSPTNNALLLIDALIASETATAAL
jgi:hypothetical protein